MQPFISTIIPTIGRPTLGKAVRSVLDQTSAEITSEIVIVNDSGSPLAELPWLDQPTIKIVQTNRRHAVMARNAGAAAATGRYFHFLDDDDWMLPGALSEFGRLAKEWPEAVVLYGGCQIVSQANQTLGQINLARSGNCASHLLGGSLLQFGSVAIRSDAFFAIGGINTSFQISEETDLFRRLSTIGEFVHSDLTLACLLRGDGWQTALDYGEAVNNLRSSRETMLDAPAAWARLRASATTPYWRGRNLKAYMASTLWNIKARRWSTALSRTLYTGLAMLAAAPSWLSGDFWQALKDTQVPASADRAMERHRSKSPSASADTP